LGDPAPAGGDIDQSFFESRRENNAAELSLIIKFKSRGRLGFLRVNIHHYPLTLNNIGLKPLPAKCFISFALHSLFFAVLSLTFPYVDFGTMASGLNNSDTTGIIIKRFQDLPVVFETIKNIRA
jgi:hypothetical protein